MGISDFWSTVLEEIFVPCPNCGTHSTHISFTFIRIRRWVSGNLIQLIDNPALPAHITGLQLYSTLLIRNNKYISLKHFHFISVLFPDTLQYFISSELTQSKMYWKSLLLTLSTKFHDIRLPIDMVRWLEVKPHHQKIASWNDSCCH